MISTNEPDPSKKLSKTRMAEAPEDRELEELDDDELLELELEDDAPAESSTLKLSILAVPVPLVERPARFPVVQVLSESEMRSTPFTNTFLAASVIRRM